MRNLIDIVEAAKANEAVSEEELLYALLVYSALSSFDARAIDRLAEKPDDKFMTPQRMAEDSYRRWHTALNKSPKEYLGWNNDPANPEYQKTRKMFRGLLNKFIDENPENKK